MFGASLSSYAWSAPLLIRCLPLSLRQGLEDATQNDDLSVVHHFNGSSHAVGDSHTISSTPITSPPAP